MISVRFGVSGWYRATAPPIAIWRSQRAFSANSSSAIFDCKHPVDFKRTALSGRKAAGAILAVLMSTTGKNSQGDIT